MGNSPATPIDVMRSTDEALEALSNLIKKTTKLSGEILTQKYGVAPPTPSDDKVVLFSRKTTLYYVHGYNSAIIEAAAKSIMDITSGFAQWQGLTPSIVELTQNVVKAIIGSGVMTMDGECRAIAFTSGGMKYKAILVINLGNVAAEKYLTKTNFQLYDHYFVILELGKVDDLPVIGPGGVDGDIDVIEKPSGDHDFEINDIIFEFNAKNSEIDKVIIGKGVQIDRQLNEKVESIESQLVAESFSKRGPNGSSFEDIKFE
jgi:hypothetical protein